MRGSWRAWWFRNRVKVVVVVAVAVLAGLVVVNRLPLGNKGSVDASQPAKEKPKLRKDGFEKLFEPGRVNVGHDLYDLTIQDVGQLDLPSGRLLAGDPNLIAHSPGDWPAFVVTVPSGRYPVSVSLVAEAVTPTRAPATPAEKRNRLVAAARVVVQPEPVVRWAMAFVPKDDPAKLKDNEYFGYGVDAGMGTFLDATSLDAMKRIGAENGPLDQVITGEADAWNLRDPISDRNVVAFYSGFGDGAYPTWIGYTAANQPAVFVTDFMVVNVP